MSKNDFDPNKDYGKENTIKLKENKMKKSDLLKDYMSSRKDTNLNEQMETYQKAEEQQQLLTLYNLDLLSKLHLLDKNHT